MASRSARCSSLYQRLKSASLSAGTSAQTISSPVPLPFPIVPLAVLVVCVSAASAPRRHHTRPPPCRVAGSGIRCRTMARRRIVVAMMMHETNTFSPVPTPLSAFRPLAGEAAVEEFKDTNTQIGGFLHVAQGLGAEIVVPL